MSLYPKPHTIGDSVALATARLAFMQFKTQQLAYNPDQRDSVLRTCADIYSPSIQ